MMHVRGGQSFAMTAAVMVEAVLLLLAETTDSRLMKQPKPDPKDAVGTARWLIFLNYWGVLNTLADDLGGFPFGNVVSFSDGLPDRGTGIPYFYLTTVDPTAKYTLKDERASFTASEYPVGTCGEIDHENPMCAKDHSNGKVEDVGRKL